MLSLEKNAIQQITLQMYEYSHGMLPTAIQLLFTHNDTVHEHNTRQTICLGQPVANREYMYINFSCIGVYIWNLSKTTINIMNSYYSFKYSLKQYLLDLLEFLINHCFLTSYCFPFKCTFIITLLFYHPSIYVKWFLFH